MNTTTEQAAIASIPSLNEGAAHFCIERNVPSEPLLIEDIGPHDRHKTVTNDVEDVVQRLVSSGVLSGRRLFYRDSNGDLSEIIIRDRKFAGFAFNPWPGRPLKEQPRS